MDHRFQLRRFVVPPYGIEFSDPPALCERWQANGLQLVESFAKIESMESIWFQQNRQGGIVTCHATPPIERKILELPNGMCARRTPRGMEIGNASAMQCRSAVQILLPERIPAAARLLGFKRFKEPSAPVTFEHVDSDDRYLMVVPKRKSFDSQKLQQALAGFGLDTRLLPECGSLKTELGISDWIENPARRIDFLQVHDAQDHFGVFATLQLAVLAYEQSSHHLDTIHLLANFSPDRPRFREFWTSNR